MNRQHQGTQASVITELIFSTQQVGQQPAHHQCGAASAYAGFEALEYYQAQDFL